MGGQPFTDGRAAPCGILFVLWTGAPRSAVPRGAGVPSPATRWHRLRDRRTAGVWEAAHRALLDRLGAADRIAWEGAGQKGGDGTGRSPMTAPGAAARYTS